MVAVAALALTGCDNPVSDSLSDKEAASVGTVVSSGTQAPGYAVSVVVPDGRFDFAVGEPDEDLATYDETYDRARDGASFVPVSWTWNFFSGLAVTRDPDAPEVEPHVSLLVGDREYSLDEAVLTDADDIGDEQSAVNYNGTAWVVVDGEPDDVDDLSLRVEYDGFTQDVDVDETSPSLRELGVAYPLYRPADDLVRWRGDCGPVRYSGPAELPDARCRLTATAVPYHQSVGWVPDRDQAWLVVQVDAYPGAVARRGDRASYAVEDLTGLAVTLEGQDPVAVVAEDPEEARATLVFAADAVDRAGDLRVAGTWESTTIGGEGAARDPLVGATWTAAVG